MRIFITLIVLVTLAVGLMLFVFIGDDQPLDEVAETGVQSMVLKNGMKVIVQENRRAPVLVTQVWYKVGGSYEHDGITGISHVLEHMMFKGTKRHPAGHFSALIAENGGRENAFTSRDYTGYYQLLEKSRLPIPDDW